MNVVGDDHGYFLIVVFGELADLLFVMSIRRRLTVVLVNTHVIVFIKIVLFRLELTTKIWLVLHCQEQTVLPTASLQPHCVY